MPKGLPKLIYSNEMEQASKHHAEEIGNNGSVSHESSNMDVKERLEYYGNGKVIAAYGESL